MLRQYQQFIGKIFRLTDATVVGVSWFFAYWLRFHVQIVSVTKGFPGLVSYAALTPLILLLWGTVFSWSGVYRSQRMLRRTDEVVQLLRAHGLALLSFLALTSLITDYRFSRVVMVSFGLSSAFLLVSFRLALRNALRWARRKGYNLRYVLIIGHSPGVESVRRQLERFPELGLRVKAQWSLQELMGPNLDSTVLQMRFKEEFAKIRPDQIFIGLSGAESMWLPKILDSIVDEGVDIRLIPDLENYYSLGCAVDLVEGVPVLCLNESPLDGWGSWLKRATDFWVSLIALVILSPILFFISLLVKWSSPGPVLYRQVRMGLDGKTFEILKFRTMPVDAEAESGPVWAKEGDQRRTSIGAFLRSTSLDELPQLWNILIGEMSLVGPWPERPIFVDQFKRQIPHYMLRHKVKAGLTGWAQIHGWRGNTSLERRIECDLFYIRNWSYSLDLRIILLTFWRGFVNKNAY